MIPLDSGNDGVFHLLLLNVLDDDVDGSSVPESLRKATGKYARVLAMYDGARATHTVRLNSDRGQAPTAFGRIIAMHERIKKYTGREQGSLPENSELVDFGRELFDALFQGNVRRLYDEARTRNPHRKLDLVLTSMIPWLAEKPWEFAYDQRRNTFLATEEVHFVRNAVTAVPVDEVEPCEQLRILVAAAQPVGYGKLSAKQEAQIIRRGFQHLEDEGLASITVLPHATPKLLQQELAHGDYAVVHFIGHGIFENGEGKLIFENQRGREVRLGESAVRQLFCKRGLSLVFLNSCQSASGSLSEFNRGLAQSLVAHGLPAVVANQYSVLDSSAASFSESFYRDLAQGLSIGQAACEARIAVNCSLQGEIIDWAVPVVYARHPGITLCAPATSSAATTRKKAQSEKTPRPKPAKERRKVGVCDTDGAFPSLGQTLQRMNAAQDVFEFKMTSLSMPLDIWDLETRAPDGEPYLRADKLSARIAGTTTSSNVEVLLCMTRHWMSDDEVLNLFTWWPDKTKSNVLVFSCAGFDSLPAEGRTTDRVIANVAAGTVAGYLADLGSHTNEYIDCALDYNEGRDFARISGRQTFHAACRDKLAKRLDAATIAALEKLQRLFHKD